MAAVIGSVEGAPQAMPETGVRSPKRIFRGSSPALTGSRRNRQLCVNPLVGPQNGAEAKRYTLPGLVMMQ
jgi:hypothetical protein